jgi:hypothetical protein
MVSAFGIMVPIDFLSQQVLSLANAGIYSYLIGLFFSLSVMQAMIQTLYGRLSQDAWPFFVAWREPSLLLNTVLLPKTVGYVSPRSERVLAWSLMLVMIAAFLLLAALVIGSGCVSVASAVRARATIAIIIAVMSTAMATSTLVAFVCAIFLKLPYRLRVAPEPSHAA